MELDESYYKKPIEITWRCGTTFGGNQTNESIRKSISYQATSTGYLVEVDDAEQENMLFLVQSLVSTGNYANLQTIPKGSIIGKPKILFRLADDPN